MDTNLKRACVGQGRDIFSRLLFWLKIGIRIQLCLFSIGSVHKGVLLDLIVKLTGYCRDNFYVFLTKKLFIALSLDLHK